MTTKIDSLWNYRDPAGTEAKFRELLASSKSEGPAFVAELQTQIARTLGLQRRFDEAHALLDEVDASLDDTMTLARARYLLERGRAFRSGGDAPRSLPLFVEAMEVAGVGGHEFYAVDAAHMVALVHEGDEAVAWHERALEMAEAATDERARGWRGSLYNNLGWTYYDLGRFEEALDLFVKHEAMLAEQGKSFNESIARWAQGKMLRAMGRLEEALAIQEGLLPHPERQGGAAEGYTREEIGECLHALGRTDEAKPYFKRAHELLSEDDWLVANESERLARLEQLGG